MTYTISQYGLGPEQTPATIKKLILWTCLCSLIAALTNNLFVFFLGIRGPLDWFALSWWGINNNLWWQPFTFLFITPTGGGGGIDFLFLINLAFNMYLLWALGSEIHERVGKTSFLKFYFICGIIAALVAFLCMPLTGQYTALSGATPSILAILVAWTLLHPEAEVLLFFLIPVKAKWIFLGLVGIILLVDLSNLDLISFIFYMSAVFSGYLYALIAWGTHSPFPFLYKFELAAIRCASGFRNHFPSIPTSRKKMNERDNQKDNNIKVVDIKTGQPLEYDDELFVDSMLEKISKSGTQSLTRKERERMDKISRSKRHEKT